ncbi:MAG: uroporphyrinogen-III synthase [Fibrobacteraceae bacterium]|nr:uroporphyrinogen-III synthase [Fibrobacteraceae bacterium]
MWWIETGLKKPSENLFQKAESLRATLVHLPILAVEKISFEIDTFLYEAIFVASPRAAQYSYSYLKNYNGKIFTVGKGTQKALAEFGIYSETFAENYEGGEYFLETLALKNNGKIPYLKWCWLSAEETALNLKELAKKFEIDITHIPVYRTFYAKEFAENLKKYSGEKCFLLRSGKAAKAIAPLLSKGDQIMAFGETTLNALNELGINENVIR